MWHQNTGNKGKNRKSRAQFSSIGQSCLTVTPWTAACQASLSINNSWSLLKVVSIESVMPRNRLILCRPPFLPPSIFLSIGVISNELVLPIRWPKYQSFSVSISPSNEYSGLISLGWTGWIPLLSKGLKSLLQHHSSKASIHWCSAFFILQLSHPYMTPGKSCIPQRTNQKHIYTEAKLMVTKWEVGREEG